MGWDPVHGGVGLGGGVDVVLLVACARRWLHSVGVVIPLPGVFLVPVQGSGGDRGQGGRSPLVLIFFDGSVCSRCAWPDRGRFSAKRVIR